MPEQEAPKPQVLWSTKNHINKKPTQIKAKKIETLMTANSRKINIYAAKIQDIICKFGFETKIYHLEK